MMTHRTNSRRKEELLSVRYVHVRNVMSMTFVPNKEVSDPRRTMVLYVSSDDIYVPLSSRADTSVVQYSFTVLHFISTRLQ
jgi:hypothetical protein